MLKVKPTHEMVITVCLAHLLFDFSSEDARSFVAQEVLPFGEWHGYMNTLNVNACFAPVDIAKAIAAEYGNTKIVISIGAELQGVSL